MKLGKVASRLVGKIAPVGLVAVMGMANTGCIKKLLLDGQLASTRKAAAATNTMSDWEVARRATSAGIAQFEGLHFLAPYNEDGLFLLTKAWAGLGFGFIEDELEQAQDKYGEDSEAAKYQTQRAVAAYTRSIFYGSKLLDMRNPGLDGAMKNVDSMKSWLKGFTVKEEDTEYLFWVGQAWMSRVNMLKDDPEAVSELFVGVEMMKRSIELDKTFSYGTATAIMASYHARSAMAELDDAKKDFEEALKLSGGKSLLIKFNYAAKYYCTKVDKENYVKLMKEIIASPDTLPDLRLQNTIAKRRAQRALGESRMELCGFPEEE
jgi:hypothetical protein